MDGVFTSATDIYSFGVVLYEMITFGAQPFPGHENNEVIDLIRGGQKMDLPSECLDDL